MNIPGYRILREIGRGNMATVHLAIQESLDREVALKVMAPTLVADSTFCARFLKEGKIIAQLSHPNIVTVHDIGAFESNYYMALEYANAGNLATRLNKISRDQSLAIIKQIANALGYAHSRGFVHRDVKPANVLFREDQSVLLSDFGIAKGMHSKSQLTMVGWSIGTPEYMSPEQAMGKSVGPQSDLYSLGIMLYQMLAGKLPYTSDDPFSTAWMHVNQPVPDLPTHCAEFQAIVNQLLQKDPAQRFSNAQELIRALNAVQKRSAPVISIAGRPPTPKKKSRASKLWRPEPNQRTTVRVVGGAANALQLESLEEQQRPLISQIGTAIGTVQQAAIEISSTLKLKIRRNIRAAVRWTVGLLVLSAFIGGGLYLIELPKRSDEVDLTARSIRPTTPTEYIRAKDELLQDVRAAYQSMLQIDPEHRPSLEESIEIVGKYEQLARSSWAKADSDLSLALIDKGLDIAPQHKGLLALKNQIKEITSSTKLSSDERETIQRLTEEAKAHIAATRFVLPEGNNAVAAYRRILQLDADNQFAQRGLDELASLLERAARTSLDRDDAEQAILRIEQGLLISPSHPGLLSLQKTLAK